MDGVTEHSELLAHLMKVAKREQRNIFISLLDLRNAFGLIHHNLIKYSLKFHNLPNEFIDIFTSIYSNSFITVAVNNIWTNPIRVERGVLQGDPSSPLLFNLCMNTFIKTIEQPKMQSLGFSWGPASHRFLRSWLQYADDAAVLAPDMKCMQQLLNLFESWCHWSGMEICRDKCLAFAMQKLNDVYSLILPSVN